jgi:hypothetical protein
LYADVRIASQWERFAVTSKPQQASLLRRVKQALYAAE